MDRFLPRRRRLAGPAANHGHHTQTVKRGRERRCGRDRGHLEHRGHGVVGALTGLPAAGDDLLALIGRVEHHTRVDTGADAVQRQLETGHHAKVPAAASKDSRINKSVK
jgi:hypothetical protein